VLTYNQVVLEKRPLNGCLSVCLLWDHGTAGKPHWPGKWQSNLYACIMYS